MTCKEQKLFVFDQIRPLAEVEIKYTQYVLDKCKRNKQKAASLPGINRKTIHKKLGTLPPSATVPFATLL